MTDQEIRMAAALAIASIAFVAGLWVNSYVFPRFMWPRWDRRKRMVSERDRRQKTRRSSDSKAGGVYGTGI